MRVPDLNWPADLFEDVAVPAEPRFVPSVNRDDPFWPSIRTRWTSAGRKAGHAAASEARPARRATGLFGEAA